MFSDARTRPTRQFVPYWKPHRMRGNPRSTSADKLLLDLCAAADMVQVFVVRQAHISKRAGGGVEAATIERLLKYVQRASNCENAILPVRQRLTERDNHHRDAIAATICAYAHFYGQAIYQLGFITRVILISSPLAFLAWRILVR